MSKPKHILDDNDASEFERLERKLDRILRELSVIKKEIKTVPTQADLEAAVQGVKDSFTAGLAAIDTSVGAAADRVIASLQTPGVDPTAQIAELQALKDSTSAAVAAETAKIDAIDPSIPVPPAP